MLFSNAAAYDTLDVTVVAVVDIVEARAAVGVSATCALLNAAVGTAAVGMPFAETSQKKPHEFE